MFFPTCILALVSASLTSLSCILALSDSAVASLRTRPLGSRSGEDAPGRSDAEVDCRGEMQFIF